MESLCELLAAATGDGVWMFPRESDVRWLTGFSGSFGAVAVDPVRGEAVLVTDARYDEKARTTLRDTGSTAQVRRCPGSSALVSVLGEIAGSRRMVVDPTQVTHATYLQLASLPGGADTGSAPMSLLRRRKADWEIERMKCAAAIADAALADVVALGLAGRTEREIRDALENRMRELGADGPAFDTIVACGPNAAVPHHSPTAAVVQNDDMVIIDVGARVDGYRSDMTRTIVVGRPSADRLELLEWVRGAQAAGVGAVAAGGDGRDVDLACRRWFEERGVGDLFIHGVGHGVGLDIHEEPFLSSSSMALLAGEVVTVEPGLYREGAGGVRIEDSVLVTTGGCIPLTNSPKDISCPPSPPTI